MKGNQKAVFGQRIDLEIIAGIQRSAQKRGESISSITERALSQFLATDCELTAYERMQYKKIIIENSLDNIANGLNLKVFGDISAKTITILAICAGFDNIHPLRDSTKNAKLSLFEVLTDIKEYDNGLFNEILPYVKKFKKLHNMFTQTTFGNENL